MILAISSQGLLALREIDDLKRFDIHTEHGSPMGCEAFRRIASPTDEAGHYWLGADAIIRMSGRQDDAGWVSSFWAMLRKVEAFGYSDLEGRRVKAHVVAG